MAFLALAQAEWEDVACDARPLGGDLARGVFCWQLRGTAEVSFCGPKLVQMIFLGDLFQSKIKRATPSPSKADS